MGTWTNADGLYIKFGADEAVVGNAGQYRTNGPYQVVEVEFNATALGLNSIILSDTVVIPKGARIESVEVISETAATSGGAAVLNVGLVRTDRSTVYDADGLVAALALTSINGDGKKNTLVIGSTGVGALVGTTLANSGLLVADYDTAAFTAGRIIVRVNFYKP